MGHWDRILASTIQTAGRYILDTRKRVISISGSGRGCGRYFRLQNQLFVSGCVASASAAWRGAYGASTAKRAEQRSITDSISGSSESGGRCGCASGVLLRPSMDRPVVRAAWIWSDGGTTLKRQRCAASDYWPRGGRGLCVRSARLRSPQGARGARAVCRMVGPNIKGTVQSGGRLGAAWGASARHGGVGCARSAEHGGNR